MFTGLVRAIGVMEEVRRTSSGARAVVLLGKLAGAVGHPVAVGDSVAVAGVCLTVAEVRGERAVFDIVEETLRRTTLGTLHPGARVNLEPALRAGDAIGGHFVTGHVDGVAAFRMRRPVGEGAECTFETGPEVLADIITKGSIALDGVSLTLAGVEEDGFAVALVPHTLQATTLGGLATGSHVNVETDMLVKAVRRILEGAEGARRVEGDMTEGFLREHGFG